MEQGIPQSLLQLLADYTSQALDAARDVTDEFEEEVSELMLRARRINSILRLIRECVTVCHSQQRGQQQQQFSAASMTAPAREDPTAPLRIALQALGQMTEELTGVPAVASATTAYVAPPPYGLLPLGKPVSLAEAALELLGHNTRVFFRRGGKRCRENNPFAAGDPHAAPRTTVFSRLAASQRKRRLTLYSARAALFPRAIPKPMTLGKGGAEFPALFVSPAVQEFAALNLEAECDMLVAFYHIDTKAQLLRELPSFRSSVEHLQDSLRAAGVMLERMGNTKEQKRQPWFEFPHYSEGVVRVVVRRSLAVDITWDPVRGSRWRVLALHWLLRSQPLQEALLVLRSSLKGSGMDSATAAVPGGALSVLPAHFEATVRYLSNCFEPGLESGCMGALRVVNAVVMEVIEAQCRALRETFFVGPLETSLSVDVRPGTHVALTLLPTFLARAQSRTGSSGDGVGPVYMKFSLWMGTIVVERRRGTDIQSVPHSDFYVDAVASVEANPASVVVVDVERMLWRLAFL